jgi:hypothetical protein
MGLDIRLPIGLMFIMLGPILLVTGLAEGTHLNTSTGAAMTVFGAIMLTLGWLGHKRTAPEPERRQAAASAEVIVPSRASH